MVDGVQAVGHPSLQLYAHLVYRRHQSMFSYWIKIWVAKSASTASPYCSKPTSTHRTRPGSVV